MSETSIENLTEMDASSLNEAASARHWRDVAERYRAIAKAGERRVSHLERRVDSLTSALVAARAESRQAARLASVPTLAEMEASSRAALGKAKASEDSARRQRDMILRALGVKGYQAALAVIRDLQALQAAAKPSLPAPINNGRPVGPDGLPCFACARATRMGTGYACRRSATACQPSGKAFHFLPLNPQEIKP